MENHPAKLLHTGHLSPHPGWSMDTHRHAHHELIVVVRGRIMVEINQVKVAAGPGDLLFYRAGWDHEERSDARDPVETYFLAFEWIASVTDLPSKLLDRHGRVRQLAQWVHEERVMQKPENQHAQSSFFHALLAEWIRLGRHQEHPLQELVRHHIGRNLCSNIGLDDLAGIAGMSKYHFIRKYRDLTGHTPMDEVRGMRVERARDLILTTDLPLKGVAARAGFRDIYHLSHAFKRRLGLPPSSLRRRSAEST